MKLSTLMHTPFRHFYEVDANGVHFEVTHKQCFRYPIVKNQRFAYWFYENDKRNESNIIVRLPLTPMGKAVGNRNNADNTSDIRGVTEENRCLLLATSDCMRTCDDCLRCGSCKSPMLKIDGFDCDKKCVGCALKQTMCVFSLQEEMEVPGKDGKPISREPIAPRGNEPDATYERKEWQKRVRRELRKILPGNYLQLAYDIFVEGYSERKLAPKYSCSASTIGNRKDEIVAIVRESEVLRILLKELG